MRHLYSFLFWTFFGTTCVLLFFVGLVVFLVTLPFDRNGLVQHLFSCFWAQLYFYANPFWHLKVEGREKLPWKGGAVIVANHQSLGDILVLFGLYRPFKWVSKASVFKAPFLGWNMALNRYVPLVRGNKDSIAKMMADCGRWLDRQVPVLLFPEGTRSPDGAVLPFKDGAFRLAKEKKVPVIPIAVTGTSRTLPKHGLLLDSRADCVVRVLDPVNPDDFADHEALRDHVRALIVAEKARIEAGQAVPTPVPQTVSSNERQLSP